MNIIVIANGDFPTGQWVAPLLGNADRIVCCDGAAENYVAWLGLQPYAQGRRVTVVGDGDSLPESLPRRAADMGLELERVVVEEQDYNDLTKATRYAMAHWGKDEGGETSITYIGATGKREDHTLGNISLLAWYMKQWPGVRFCMRSDYGTFLPFENHARLATRKGQQVSLFSLSPDVPVSAKGLRWPIAERRLGWWWEATLNEALGEECEVWGGTMVAYLVDKA